MGDTASVVRAVLGPMLVELSVVEQRYHAVMEVLAAGVPVVEVAERYGVSRKTRLHHEPQLGAFDLVDITTAQVRTWRAERVAAGGGTPTVAGAYRLLRAIMATAVDDELVRRNPCRIPGADKDNSLERPVATIPEVFAIAGRCGSGIERWC